MAFGDSAEDQVIINKWNRCYGSLHIFFWSDSQKEKENETEDEEGEDEEGEDEKFLFKRKDNKDDAQWAGCVFSMLYDEGIFERISPLHFIEEHFAFMDWCGKDENGDLVYGPFTTKSDDEIEDIVKVWKSEWVKFTESVFFKNKSDYLKHPQKLKEGDYVKKGPSYQTVDKRFRKVLKDMYDCIEYKCNTGKLVQEYRERYGPDERLVRTAECSPGYSSSATDSDEEPDQELDEEHGLERRIEQYTDVCVKVINALIAKGLYHNPRN
jgi:hypothetical protein